MKRSKPEPSDSTNPKSIKLKFQHNHSESTKGKRIIKMPDTFDPDFDVNDLRPEDYGEVLFSCRPKGRRIVKTGESDNPVSHRMIDVNDLKVYCGFHTIDITVRVKPQDIYWENIKYGVAKKKTRTIMKKKTIPIMIKLTVFGQLKNDYV